MFWNGGRQEGLKRINWLDGWSQRGLLVSHTLPGGQYKESIAGSVLGRVLLNIFMSWGKQWSACS